jgi:hypothetical protein
MMPKGHRGSSCFLNPVKKRRQVCCWLLGAFSICRARPATFFLPFLSPLQEKNRLMRVSAGYDVESKM